MSIKVMARVWDTSDQSGTALLMLLAIADFSDDDGRAYPAVPTLARKCRMTPRNANLILSALRKSGELVIQLNEGPKGTNLYYLPLKPASPLKDSSPLKPTSSTPEAGFPKPLKPASDEPSVNRHEPSIERVRSPKGSRLSADWSLPDDFRDWSIQSLGWTPERCTSVAEVFRDYWIAMPGSKGTKTDWPATWRNWCRREGGNKKVKASAPRADDFNSKDYGQGGKL